MTKNLKDLRVKKNDFRDKTAKIIAQAFEKPTCKVERVDLSNNMINDSGGELIGLSIAENEHLLYLNLRKNNLRATSGAMFSQSMKENKKIKCLKLEKNSININFLEQIAGYVRRNNQSFLEKDFNEIKNDRNHYLATQTADWKNVKDKKKLFTEQILELNKNIERL